MSEKAEPNRQFEPLPLSQAIKLLQESVKTLASTSTWTKNQEIVFNGHISLISDVEPIFYLWEPKDLDPVKFANALKASGELLCRFSISLESVNLFFKSEFAGRDPAGLKFKIPSAVYRVQRRKDMRMPIPPGYTLKVTYVDPEDNLRSCSKKVVDISAGGLAISINPDEETLYANGLILYQMTFTIRGVKITTQAEVRHSRGLKVGLLFIGISAQHAEVINGYVTEETRKYFSSNM